MSALTAAMSEDDWKAWVLDTARLYGWRISHFRPARTERGWRTPVEGHKGFPDLVLARAGVVLIVELKKDNTHPDDDQQAWLDALGPIARVWRPRDREQVLRTLSAARPDRPAATWKRLQQASATTRGTTS
jgi:hypothetical protein